MNVAQLEQEHADLTAWKQAALARDLHLADLLVSAGYPGGDVGEGLAWVIGELKKADANVEAIHADRERIRAEHAALRQALGRIADPPRDGCGCTHDDDTCCARLAETDYFCPECIAFAALASPAVPAPEEAQ